MSMLGLSVLLLKFYVQCGMNKPPFQRWGHHSLPLKMAEHL